jgi:hypothetical protein
MNEIRGIPERIESDADSIERNLFRLVLTLVELVRQLMDRQAIRRMDDLDAAMTELRGRYGLSRADLNIDLGPLGSLLGE